MVNIIINMKLRYVMAVFLMLALAGFVAGGTFMPSEGTFAFQEVEIFDINGINFTVPTDYEVTFENETEMHFKDGKDKLKISVIDNGTIKKVKENKTKKITSGKTMLGSVEGYLVDRNGSYSFSYNEGDKLVVVKSKNMPLMIGAMGKD